LEKNLADLLEKDARRQELGANGLRIVEENSGATLRTVEWLMPSLLKP
jgi:3-deoxy-D-manno-octulosonic-acid transferase